MNADTLIAGRYRVLSELGSGGFGAVYRVQDTHAGDALRALKTLKPNANVSQLAERFKEEAKALSSLKHAGTPKCWDFGDDEIAGLYFVLDYIEGQTLFDRIEAGTMPLTERFQRAIEFFDVLGHVHGRGILHRDIKPENLMVPKDGGHLILLDFGIAKDLAQSAVHTATGIILGTPYYLTPEQLTGERYTAKSDLYQAALVTYWLLTGGTHCFAQVDSVAQLVVQRQMAPRLGAIERAPWFARARAHAKPLLDCLEPKLESRPGTARVVRDALVAMRDAALGEAPAPTNDGVTGPVRKVSGKVSRPTVVQPPSSGAQTVAAERPPSPARPVTPAGVPVPAPDRADPVAPWLPRLAAVVGVTVLAAVGMFAIQTKPRPVDTGSPSPGPSAVTSPSAAATGAELAAALDATVGAGGAQIDDLLQHAAWKAELKRTPPDPGAVLAQVWGAERLDTLRRALAAAPEFEMKSGTAAERKILSGLFACQALDMLADSANAPRPLGEPLAKVLGRFAGQEYYPSFDRMPAFGQRLENSIKESDGGQWSWTLPPDKAREVMFAVILTKFSPKALLEVLINRSVRVYFHNGEGRASDGSFRIEYEDLGNPKFSGVQEYWPTRQPHYVVMGRRLPRALFTPGVNSLAFRIRELPGPLRPVNGRNWAWSSGNSLWAAFVGFKVDD